MGEVEKKVKERQKRTGKSQDCWPGPASSWDGSQVMFAAGNLTELSKQSNNILLERKGVAAKWYSDQFSLQESLLHGA